MRRARVAAAARAQEIDHGRDAVLVEDLHDARCRFARIGAAKLVAFFGVGSGHALAHPSVARTKPVTMARYLETDCRAWQDGRPYEA